jgi:hypothetical protein
MIERTQPVCTGVDAKGELVWTRIAMPRWQMEMFRVPYVGDFMAYWMKRVFCDKTGIELEEDDGSLTLTPTVRRKAWKHPGD